MVLPATDPDATSRSPHERRRLADRVQARVLADAWFADVVADLDRVAAWRDDDRSGSRPPQVSTATLRHLNASLRARQDVEATTAAVTTRDVIELLPELNNRGAVHSRVERGHLLAFKTAGGRNRYPRWQFDLRHRDRTVPVIDDLVRMCREQFAGDVVAFDLMVRARQDRLGDRSIADLLADGRWDDAIAAATTTAEQAG